MSILSIMSDPDKGPKMQAMMAALSLDYLADILNVAIADDLITEAQGLSILTLAESNPQSVREPLNTSHARSLRQRQS